MPFIRTPSLHRLALFVLLALMPVVLFRCDTSPPGLDEETEERQDPALLSTWGVIRQNIFEPKCVGCHRPGTSFAGQ